MKKIEVLEHDKEVNPFLEIPGILAGERKAVLFRKVKGSSYHFIGNVCNSREKFASALGVKREALISAISEAIDNPKKCAVAEDAACQEVVEKNVDLTSLPIPTFTSKDMGPYITSGVFIASDPEYGQNMSFHRATPISKNKLVARVCQRHLNKFLERAGGELNVAVCIGLHPAVLLSAAISPEIGVDELEIANSLHKTDLVKCKTNDLFIPADSEIVLEGRITSERHDEGPFPDITRTYDIVRKEPVVEINCITHRTDAIYHSILPALEEHQLLMGMPREPLIYNRVSKICDCRNVLLTPGGCGWLHGIVQIAKKKEDEPRKAIEAAFSAHRSLKHLVVVDSDININNMDEVEWSIATRFQGGSDMVVLNEKGSSLDPSACRDLTTTKIGLDATIPSGKNNKMFMEVMIGA